MALCHKGKIMDNQLIQNFNSQTAALIGNQNLQIANLMTQNQQLKEQLDKKEQENTELKTQLKTLRNNKPKSNA